MKTQHYFTILDIADWITGFGAGVSAYILLTTQDVKMYIPLILFAMIDILILTPAKANLIKRE